MWKAALARGSSGQARLRLPHMPVHIFTPNLKGCASGGFIPTYRVCFLNRWRSLPSTCVQTRQELRLDPGWARGSAQAEGVRGSARLGGQPPAAASGGAWPPGTASAAHAAWDACGKQTASVRVNSGISRC